MKLLTILCVPLFIGCGPAQSPVVPVQPSIEVTFPNRPLNASAEHICGLDFKNIQLIRDEDSSAQLRQGKYEHRDKRGGFESVVLDGVSCIQDQNSEDQYAIVQSTWTYGFGSSNNDCVVQIVALRSQRPVVVQQLDFDCHALSTGASFNSKTRELVVRARTNDDSPHCCARTLDVVIYTWDNGRLRQASFRQIPAVVKKGPGGLEEH